MHPRDPKREGERGEKKLFKYIMVENFPDLGKETDMKLQEAQRVLFYIIKKNPK